MGMIKRFFKKKDFENLKIIYPEKVFIGKDCNFSFNTFIYADGNEVKIGDGCVFEIGVYLRLWGGKIKIGNNFFIGPYSVIYGHGGVEIGKDVLIASHVTIIPANHLFANRETPIRFQGEAKKGIIIGDGVWVATGATILDGVKIGKHSVIAAGAVVTKDVADYTLVGGIPAKIIKEL